MRAFNGTARILVDPWYKWWHAEKLGKAVWTDMVDMAKEIEHQLLWGRPSKSARIAKLKPMRPDDVVDALIDAPGKPPF